MALLQFIFGLSLLMTIIKSEDGCSDDGCYCHPDQECHPAYAVDNPCQTTKKGCYGPVVVTVFSMEINKTAAGSLLPKNLTLSPPLIRTDENGVDLYPISIMFNQQHNVATWNYLEFILTLEAEWDENVASNYKYKGPFGYGAKLYLDELGPTVAGQAYGVNKEVANITQNCDMNGNCKYEIYELKDKGGAHLMTATWNPTPTASKYVNGTTNTNFVNIVMPELTLPMVGEYPVNQGVYQCGICDWFLNNALIQPVTGEVIIHKSFFGEMPTGTFSFANSIDQRPMGAFRMETMWMFEQDASPSKETCTGFVPPN